MMAKYRMDTLFQFPWCVGEFNPENAEKQMAIYEFQFPWCVGEFNMGYMPGSG